MTVQMQISSPPRPTHNLSLNKMLRSLGGMVGSEDPRCQAGGPQPQSLQVYLPFTITKH